MQYLKDEIRDNIIEEALNEFREKGYRGASIRTIAKNSGTSVGNMYKYFRSKESLYESLIGGVYNRLMDYIMRFYEVRVDDDAENIFFALLDKIMEIVKDNSVELEILLNRSEGSKYENSKIKFIDFITRIVTNHFNYQFGKQGMKIRDNFLICILSHSLVESICLILSEKKSGEEINKLIRDMIDIFYMNLDNKINVEPVK